MQLSLFYDYQSILDSSSFIRKYDALFQAAETVIAKTAISISRFGRKGYGFSSFVKALVYKHAQQIKSIPELIRDLESRPLLSEMCGFPLGKLPDASRFYEFLAGTNNSEIQDMLLSSGKFLAEKGLVSLDIIIADSKPVKANTRHNNQKNPNRSLDKEHKIRRNPKASLGYYSYLKQPNGSKKDFTFFWGYRTHVLISKEGIPLVEITKPNKYSDKKVAKMLLKKFTRTYGQKKNRIFIGDSAYDYRELYKFIANEMKSNAYIPINPRNTKDEKTLSDNNLPLCNAGMEMKYCGLSNDNGRVRKKFRCPIKAASKKTKSKLPEICPVDHSKFSEGACYGCTAYVDITNDERSQVPRASLHYKKTYDLRTEVERYFSRLGDNEAEQTSHYNYKSVRNQMSIAHLTMSLTAVAAAIILGAKDKIRCFRTFAEAV